MGLFKPSAGYRYILHRSKESLAYSARQQMREGKCEGYHLPTPDAIQSDNGSHFSRKKMQE